MTAKNRATLNSDADANLADNTAGDISPADVRAAVKDLADSALVQEAFAAVASAATVDLAAESSSFVNITGTTTITSFGTPPAGVLCKLVKFAGALTLTHHATDLILPGGQNITTEAHDFALMHGAGGSSWRCLLYFRATGRPLTEATEGTFTPVAEGTTAAGTGTYTVQTGRYTKIGRLVFFEVSIGWSAHTGTGNLQITGLPFTSAASVTPMVNIASNGLTFSNQLACRVLASSTTIQPITISSGGGIGVVAMDTVVVSIVIAGCYVV